MHKIFTASNKMAIKELLTLIIVGIIVSIFANVGTAIVMEKTILKNLKKDN